MSFVRLFLFGIFFIIVSILGSIIPAFAASSPWTQTNWNGGSGQSAFTDTTKYSSGSNIFTGIANQVVLSSNISTGTGNDGAITVSSDKNINTDNMISGRSCADGGDAVNYSVTTNVATGSSSITLSSTPASGCLSAGDEILIINLQGTSGDNSNVGKYETATIQSIATATLTLTGTISYNYDGTTQKIMVQRVPNYTNVTVSSSKTLTATGWDGTKGGVLFFKATGTVTVTGSISTTGKGYAGGASIVSANTDGKQGEGYIGAAGTQSNNANGNGGGGGRGRQDSGGGGGGGYSAAGTNGENSTFAGGTGGGLVGVSSLTTLFLGGGGGSGGADEDGASSGAGGTGGGIIGINAGTITVSGTIVASGNSGSNGVNNSGCGMGGGGGGAGGSVLINGTSITLGSNLTTASAGSGGSRGGGCGGNGGAGAAGRIALYSQNSISGTTSPTYGTAAVTYATSGTLTSSIFDSEFSSPTWGILTFVATTPTNTSLSVKIRTGSQSNLSDATAFSSCTAITSGSSIATNACIGTSRYAQYQLSFSTSDTATSAAFTSFSLAFASPTPTPTPTPTAAANSGSFSTSSSSNTSNTGCSASAPSGTPNLYQLDPSTSSVTLYFTPVSGADSYYISYGKNPSVNQYATSFTYANASGAASYTISNLQPGTLYYFQVRGGNGCATGNWSGINSVATLGGSQNADTISNIVQSVFPEKTLKIVSSKLTSQKSKACSYTVESGDSLWSIASSHLGHGADYIILKALNDSTTGLHVGQVLQLPCDNKPQTIAKAVEEIKQLGVSLAVKVLNTENQPVSGATVTLHSKVQIAKTDIHGIAKFSDVEKGKHKVLITYDGYTGSENLHIDGKKKKQTLTMKVQLQGFSSIFVMTILSILGIIIVVLLTVVFLLFKKMKKQQK